jgi:peptidoglycan/LPS O-acetylase OafA/YrhL
MTVSSPERFHDLDALRAFAMLLGIVLHGMMSFIELPVFVWPAQDLYQHKEYRFVLEAIHGFRLPLFFLISGFFTTMMWRKRGLNFTIKRRAKRIGYPLLTGMITIVPVIFVIAAISSGLALSSNRLFKAAKTGELSFIENSAKAGGNLNRTMLIGTQDPPGLAALHLAVLHDQADTARLLLEHGADPDVRQAGANQLGIRPLHIAAAKADMEIFNALLAAGADVNVRATAGFTPLDVAQDAERLLGDDLGIKFAAASESQQMIPLLIARGGLSGDGLAENASVSVSEKSEEEMLYDMIIELPDWALLILGLCAFPIFVHLWFLWYLIWLVAMFAMFVKLAQRFGWKLPSRIVSSPRCWLLLIPLTFAAQLLMFQSPGPDTAGGLVPWPPILFYYAIFFGFGAIAYGNPDFEQKAGRQWPLLFVLSLGALVAELAGRELRLENFALWHPIVSLCSVIYVWAMTFGMIGLFRKFFSKENKRIRYVSDSSYWLYIAHLPVLQVLQIWMSDWALPSIVKFVIICGITTGVLLVAYEYLIRYSQIGTMLNGARKRPERIAGKEALDASS